MEVQVALRMPQKGNTMSLMRKARRREGGGSLTERKESGATKDSIRSNSHIVVRRWPPTRRPGNRPRPIQLKLVFVDDTTAEPPRLLDVIESATPNLLAFCRGRH